LPCEHKCCAICVDELFDRSLTLEELFPPRCCGQTIPPELVSHLLTERMFMTFYRKKVEFSTSKRLYCSNPTCSTFLPPQETDVNWIDCKQCGTLTCISCKHGAHDGECADDIGAKELRSLAEENGWKACPRCEWMIELSSGCQHITCICNFEFCYSCGAPSGICDC
ncbi:hypothetical protein B0J14DRAFT_493984, partial [Halenospora varia]